MLWLVAYLVGATSPLWVTALLNLRANWRQHQRDLYGDKAD